MLQIKPRPNRGYPTGRFSLRAPSFQRAEEWGTRKFNPEGCATLYDGVGSVKRHLDFASRVAGHTYGANEGPLWNSAIHSSFTPSIPSSTSASFSSCPPVPLRPDPLSAKMAPVVPKDRETSPLLPVSKKSERTLILGVRKADIGSGKRSTPSPVAHPGPAGVASRAWSRPLRGRP